MTRGEEIQTAIEQHDAATLRRIAGEARKEETRALLDLLAGMIDGDGRPKRTTQSKRTA